MGALRRAARPAFTLLELVVALSVMTILMGGMASAVLVATKAMPAKDSGSSTGPAKVRRLANRISGDLALATEFILMDPGIVEFWVPDRGHGAGGPEKMRYEWTGTPGDPLTLRYNDSAGVTLCENVHDFSLEYIPGVGQLLGTPNVLLVVDDDQAPDAQDQARQALIESFGFSVTLIDVAGAEALESTTLPGVDVMYVTELVDDGSLASKNRESPFGIVVEDSPVKVGLGFGSKNNRVWETELELTASVTHEITAPLGSGTITLLTDGDYMVFESQSLAPGRELLGHSLWDDEFFIVVDAGRELYAGGLARGRRVSLPWGDWGFDIGLLTEDGKTIMRRSIVWAAAPAVVGDVRLSLQIGPDPSNLIEAIVPLLNEPEWP